MLENAVGRIPLLIDGDEPTSRAVALRRGSLPDFRNLYAALAHGSGGYNACNSQGQVSWMSRDFPAGSYRPIYCSGHDSDADIRNGIDYTGNSLNRP